MQYWQMIQPQESSSETLDGERTAPSTAFLMLVKSALLANSLV
jgi:hypothetical protein